MLDLTSPQRPMVMLPQPLDRELPGLAWAALMNQRAAKPGEVLRMSRLIVVRATWDQEASVWVAESSDLPGLITEAESLDALDAKLSGLIQDLLEDDDDDDLDIPIEVIASYSRRVRVTRE